MNSTQLHRIRTMEQFLRNAVPVLEDLQMALTQYETALPQLNALADYYESALWQQDYADDYDGKIPADLPRGVLSEDALYDLLCEQDALRKKMQALCQSNRKEV